MSLNFGNSYSDFEQKCKSLNLSKNSDQKDKIMFNEIKEETKKWEMPKNPNKGGCCTGTRIVKPFHCSGTIRNKLPTYISNCPLYYCCGSRGNNCCPEFVHNISEYTLVPNTPFSLISKFSSAEFKQIIGPKQFDCKLTIDVLINNKSFSMGFWAKIFTDSVFVKACGTSQRTEIMTFAPRFTNKITDGIMMVISARTGILGEGYGNLVADPRLKKAPKRAIGAEAMLWIYENNVDDIEISIYCRNYYTDNVTEIKVNLESENLKKNNRDDPMNLYTYQFNAYNNMVDRPFQMNNIASPLPFRVPPPITDLNDDINNNNTRTNNIDLYNNRDQSNVSNNNNNNMPDPNNRSTAPPLSISPQSIFNQSNVCNNMTQNNNYYNIMVGHQFQFNNIMDDINNVNNVCNNMNNYNNNNNINKFIDSLLSIDDPDVDNYDNDNKSNYNSNSSFNFNESPVLPPVIPYEVNDNWNYNGYGASRYHTHVARDSRYNPMR